MTNFIIRRLIQSVILLFFISILIYVILNIVPGGPFDMLKLSNPRVGPVAHRPPERPARPGQAAAARPVLPKGRRGTAALPPRSGPLFSLAGQGGAGRSGAVLDDADRARRCSSMIWQSPGLYPAVDGHVHPAGDCAGRAHRHLSRRSSNTRLQRLRGDRPGLLRPIHAHLLDRPDGDGHLRRGPGLVSRPAACATAGTEGDIIEALAPHPDPSAAAIPSWRAKSWPPSWMACGTWRCRRWC